MAVTGLWPAGRSNTVASGHWVLTDLRILKQARGGKWSRLLLGRAAAAGYPRVPSTPASACLT